MENTIQQHADSVSAVVAEHGVSEEATPGRREATRETTNRPSPLTTIFGVYIDPRTWGALLFTLISLVTGVVYFSWAVTGLALSVAFSILIIGLPFAVLFLLSVRGLAALDAQLTRGLLGVRIQHPAVLPESKRNWWERLKTLATASSTWRAMLYLVLQLPLGVMYFTLDVVLVAFSLSVMALPFAFWLGEPGFIIIGSRQLAMSTWLPVALEIAGFLMLTASLHVIRAVAGWHVRYAKSLLAG